MAYTTAPMAYMTAPDGLHRPAPEHLARIADRGISSRSKGIRLFRAAKSRFAELTGQALKAGSLSAFWGPAGAWLGAAALAALIGCLGNSLATWTAERFVPRMRAAVFRHVQDLPPHFFKKHVDPAPVRAGRP